MSTLSFPSNPTLNDTYTFNGKTWVWNGSYWALQNTGSINNVPIGTITPSSGAFTTLSSTGNTTLGNILGNITPVANVTYNLGSNEYRWQDIWLANSTIYLGEASISATDGAIVLPANSTVGGSVLVASPLITAIDYPGDDTAADPAGGQTISIEGSNFQSGASVYVDGSVVGVVSFVSSSVLQFVSPAKAAGSYSLYVVNPNGSTAIAVPGIQYSGVPAWSTAAGSLGTPYETNPFNTTVTATGDAPVTYAVAAGNSLPTDMSLTTANGYLSVATVPATNNDTTYNFNIVATDAELQDTPRQFSVTYKVDVVTWDSPANAASYSWPINTANSVSLSATSAAGKSVSFAVQSGSLPANVNISGNLITGTPNTVQSNTSVVIRATAATTNRFADRTLYFTTYNPSEPWTVTASPTQLAVTNNRTLTNYNNLPNTYPEVQISPDGTKLSVWDDANSNFMMYELNPANTLGTLPSPYVNNSGLGGSRLAAFYWKPDGMANIQIWWDLGRCYRYDVSSPWNPGSYSPGSIYTGGWASAFSSRITGLYMSSDGTKAFIAGDNKVALYTMASPWVVNGLTYNSQFVVPNTNWVLKVFFKPDGTRMFVSVIGQGGTNYEIRQYNLGTAWDMSTATLANTFITNSYNNAGAIGLSFTSDGTKMYTGAFATNSAVRIWNTDA